MQDNTVKQLQEEVKLLRTKIDLISKILEYHQDVIGCSTPRGSIDYVSHSASSQMLQDLRSKSV